MTLFSECCARVFAVRYAPSLDSSSPQVARSCRIVDDTAQAVLLHDGVGRRAEQLIDREDLVVTTAGTNANATSVRRLILVMVSS